MLSVSVIFFTSKCANMTLLLTLIVNVTLAINSVTGGHFAG